MVQLFLRKRNSQTKVQSLVGIDDLVITLPGNLFASPAEHDHMRRQIRDLGYDGLKKGQWVKVLGFDKSIDTAVMDNLDSFISVFGRYVSINNRDDLKIALATYETFKENLPRDSFLYCLAETALNQVLDERKIGRIEMNGVRSRIDAQLAEQNGKIVQIIRERIGELLNGEL